MAKYDVTYSCGHSGVVSLIGPHKTREWRLEQETKKICPDCWEAKRKEEREKANTEALEKAKEMELPELTGTEKQVAWANTIRQKMIEKIEGLEGVKLVPAEKVVANNYNPNNVAKNNMELLMQSILDNGFCFPIVTIYDHIDDNYVIIDGFHRYTILKDWLQVDEIPIIVLEHDIKQRMAATVQFNRARGVHQVELMGDLVQALVNQGMEDIEISKHLGMEVEEVFRLKQITGIAELFKNQTYSKSWGMVEVDEIA